MRGAVASVFAKRLSEANKEYLPNTFNPYKDNSFGLMIDANILYGGILKTFPLPLGDFEIDTTAKLRTILETTDDSRWSVILNIPTTYSTMAKIFRWP